ncbi:MAG: hypothetical protein R2716_04325 [Microthrixaceae bacterium]
MELPSPELLELLVGEIHDVEGVDVRRALPPRRRTRRYTRSRSRRTSSRLAGAELQDEALVAGAASLLSAEWSAMVTLEDSRIVHSVEVRQALAGRLCAGDRRGSRRGAGRWRLRCCRVATRPSCWVAAGRRCGRERRILAQLCVLALGHGW